MYLERFDKTVATKDKVLSGEDDNLNISNLKEQKSMSTPQKSHTQLSSSHDILRIIGTFLISTYATCASSLCSLIKYSFKEQKSQMSTLGVSHQSMYSRTCLSA